MNLRLHEMAYTPWIIDNLKIDNLELITNEIKRNPKIKASLKKLAQEWEFTKKSEPESLMKVIEGEILIYKVSQRAYKEVENFGEEENFKKKIEWLQKGLDSGEFLKY